MPCKKNQDYILQVTTTESSTFLNYTTVCAEYCVTIGLHYFHPNNRRSRTWPGRIHCKICALSNLAEPTGPSNWEPLQYSKCSGQFHAVGTDITETNTPNNSLQEEQNIYLLLKDVMFLFADRSRYTVSNWPHRTPFTTWIILMKYTFWLFWSVNPYDLKEYTLWRRGHKLGLYDCFRGIPQFKSLKHV